MNPYLSLHISSKEYNNITKAIDNTISFSACHEIHPVSPEHPLSLSPVADFLVGLHVTPIQPCATIRLTISEKTIYEWTITENTTCTFGNLLEISELSHLRVQGLIPLLSFTNIPIQLHTDCPVTIKCMYMTSYSIHLRYRCMQWPIHMIVDDATYTIKQGKIEDT